MLEDIMETVEVGAVFAGGRIIPSWFVWHQRKYHVEKISYTWKERRGEELIYSFSVVAGADMYEISFCSLKLQWVLNRIYIEG